MIILTNGDSAALYGDNGQLITARDYSYVIERACELAGVEFDWTDSAYMMGQNSWGGVAKTLDEVDTYRLERDEEIEEAKRLEAEAARLAKQAENIRTKYNV